MQATIYSSARLEYNIIFLFINHSTAADILLSQWMLDVSCNKTENYLFVEPPTLQDYLWSMDRPVPAFVTTLVRCMSYDPALETGLIKVFELTLIHMGQVAPYPRRNPPFVISLWRVQLSYAVLLLSH